MRTSLLLLLCSTVAWSAPKPPRATPVEKAPEVEKPSAEEKSKQAKARGDAAMDAGRPADALLAYTEAASFSPSPALHYNRARAYEKLQQFPQALEFIERFEAEADAALKAKVPKLGELISTYRGKTSRLFIELSAEGVEVRLGERIIGISPLPQPVVVNAGPAEALSVVSEKYFPLSQQLALPGGADVHVKVPLASKVTQSVLRVSSPQVGAVVTVDEAKEGGNVPFDAVVEPGNHRVQVRLAGYLPALTSVLVQAGELRLVEVALKPELRLFERWYFWAALGAVVAAGVAVAVAWSIEQPVRPGTLNLGEPPIAPSALPRFSF